jgi:coniferyl-aldehyde dehydrogenase
VQAVTGGPDVAAAMSRLPFDKVLFTGSTGTGRAVAKACAENLVPTVLELGGKSPAIIDLSADLAAAAQDLMAGKLLNAGQTCVAPDYVFVPREQMGAFVEAAREAANKLFPDPARRDYTALVRPQDHARLQSLIDGTDTRPLFDPPLALPRFTPCLVLDPAPESVLMREEIFGPVLPVLGYEDIDQVLNQLAAMPTPLALYWFGRDAATKEKVLQSTRSGGVAINDTVIHVAVEALPFGGLGPSGMGGYHGRAGFEAFTHRRAVFEQSPLSLTRMLRPPYGDLAARILKSMIR